MCVCVCVYVYICICKKFMSSCIMYYMNICGRSIISHAFDHYTALYTRVRIYLYFDYVCAHICSFCIMCSMCASCYIVKYIAQPL